MLFNEIEYKFITSLQSKDKLHRRNMQIKELNKKLAEARGVATDLANHYDFERTEMPSDLFQRYSDLFYR